jgi:tRNA threonylcarbamoyladenosine biosynthesis protein TsaB
MSWLSLRAAVGNGENGMPRPDDWEIDLPDQFTAADRIAALGTKVQAVGSGAGLLSEAYPELSLASADPVVAPAPTALARLTRSVDPAAHPPRPLYLRAPDAAPPTRLPGQPRQTAP